MVLEIYISPSGYLKESSPCFIDLTSSELEEVGIEINYRSQDKANNDDLLDEDDLLNIALLSGFEVNAINLNFKLDIVLMIFSISYLTYS